MRNFLSPFILFGTIAALFLGGQAGAAAGELILDLGKSKGVTFVGAVCRWDADGNAHKPVDPKAVIDKPRVTAQAVRQKGSRWVFKKLPPGRYDLVLLVQGRVRVEGFHYPPVTEFDPYLPPTSKAPAEARAWIVKDIAKSPHYENKVAPLFLGGDDKQVRILVQLVRDQPTSYDADFGAPVATVRHEVWQYTSRYGGWTKDRRTKILDRLLLAKSEFNRWTWVWEPRLGGIEVSRGVVKVVYEVPGRFNPKTARGWLAGR